MCLKAANICWDRRTSH